MQFKAMCGYNSALVVANEVRTLFAKGSHDVLQIADLYPILFDSEEIEKKKQERIAKAKEERMKANLLAYASAWNKKLRKE